jgi:hypothetical protein
MTKHPPVGPRQICRGVILVLLALFAIAPARAMSGTEKIVTDHNTYTVGETIKVGFTNGPAHAKDWIGIFKEGDVPGRTGVSSVKYLYVGGGTSSSGALANGEVTFTGGLSTAGNYVAYFLENDGYRVLAQEAFTVIPATDPQVRTDKQLYTKGDDIKVTFSRGPGNPRDFIAIFAAELEPGIRPQALAYVDGTQDGQTGVTSGTITFAGAAKVPGNYVAYLFGSDDYNNVLAREPFQIVLSPTGLSTVIPDHQHYLPGQPVRVKFDGGHGSESDWVGVYRPGELPGGANIFSTDWQYVGGTKDYGLPLKTGEIVLPDGFAGPNFWKVYFLLNDAYEITGVNSFQVLDPASPIIGANKKTYNPAEAITITFTNAPGNAADWIAIYPKGVDPQKATATLWNYLDGTHTGTPGITEGSMTFSAGINTQDEWTAYLFENDGYTVLAQEDFSVRASGVLPAYLVSITPIDTGTSVPTADLKVVLQNRGTTVDLSTLSVKLDGTTVVPAQSVNGDLITLTTAGTQIYPVGSSHSYTVSFKDSAGAQNTKTVNFTIAPYSTITLPTPLFLETFDSTAEGSLPTGWIASNSSTPDDIAADLHHAGSSAYNNFTVVDASRLAGSFLTYAGGVLEAAPFAQILSAGISNIVVNGSYVRKYANNHVLFGMSGYHGGASQILEVTTPDYNLSGKQNVNLSFHSLLEQNQDSIEGIEVSNDAGATWHPVVYYLDPRDILKNTDGFADADLTFNTPHGDVAHFPDGSGGTYAAFLKAPIDATALAHTVPRLDDNPADGTRVEIIRVPEADNKPQVRFRIFYAGTDSWYYGLDDFGLYSIAPDVRLTITGNNGSVTLSWPAGTGMILQSSPTMAAGSWSAVNGVTGTTFTTTPTTTTFYRLAVP